jgi:hypothetical protein
MYQVIEKELLNSTCGLQDPRIDKKFVPTLDMSFDTAEEALRFYRDYASLAGFDVRRNRFRNGGRAQEVECKFSGTYTGGPGPDRSRGKTTMKKQCKAMVTIARLKDGPER